jgi:hypothetical protein
MTTREKLVDSIIDLAGDEYLQSPHDLIELAKESDEQLIDRLIQIAHYYKRITNE